jgi:hypothetical protein
VPFKPHRHARELLLLGLRSPSSLPSLAHRDWDLLLRVARRLRLLGRLGEQIDAAGLWTELPAAAARQLHAARVLAARRRQMADWEIECLLRALAPLGQSLLLLKGAAYSRLDLPNARGRIFADVDFMMPRSLLPRVERLLHGAGWGTAKLDAYDELYYREWMHELPPMRHVTREMEIDIHHTILPRTGRLRPDAERLFAAARPLPDPRLRVLSPTDMVLHNTVHLFQDGDLANALRELVDLHDLLRHFGTDAEFRQRLVPRAKELGLLRPLYYGLRYSRRLLHTEIPDPVVEQAREGAPKPGIRALMDRLVPTALLPLHPDYPHPVTDQARRLLYIRSHWLRMPPFLLTKHLFRKAFISPRKARAARR